MWNLLKNLNPAVLRAVLLKSVQQLKFQNPEKDEVFIIGSTKRIRMKVIFQMNLHWAKLFSAEKRAIMF